MRTAVRSLDDIVFLHGSSRGMAGEGKGKEDGEEDGGWGDVLFCS